MKIKNLIIIIATIALSIQIANAYPVYDITNCTDLQGMNQDITAHYQLTNDIDCTDTINWNEGAGFLPLTDADPATYFSGGLNGNNHNISNLFINESKASLFRNIDGATIEDVNLINPQMYGTAGVAGVAIYSVNAVFNNVNVYDGFVQGGDGTGAGGLIANPSTGTTIINCHSTTNIIGGSSDSYGGLVGANEGIIINSSATGNVTSNGTQVGGLVGWNYGTIITSYSTGDTTGTTDVGGLVGKNEAGVINESYSTGIVNASTENSGGLVGNQVSNSSIITHSYSSSNVYCGWSNESYDGNQAGGLVGYLQDGLIEESYATGNVSAFADGIGGLVGGQELGLINNTYATGNVLGASTIEGNGGTAGLVGFMNGGEVTNSYSTGTISFITEPSLTSQGGAIGIPASVSSVFYDNETTMFSNDLSNSGTPKTTAEMQTQSTFTDWDFTNTWVMDDYPQLRWAYTAPITPPAPENNNNTITYDAGDVPKIAIDGGSKFLIGLGSVATLIGFLIVFGIIAIGIRFIKKK